MAEDVRADSTVATIEAASGAPAVTSPGTIPEPTAGVAPNIELAIEKLELTIQPRIDPAIESPAEPIITVAEAPKSEIKTSEIKTSEIKIPAAPQLDTASAAPPVFLREHEQRTPPRPAVAPKAPPAKAPPAKPAPAKAPNVAAEAKTKSRFTLLAATLAFSAGLGAAAGAVGVPLLTQITSAPATAAVPVPAGDTSAELNALRGVVAQLTTELGAVRTALEQSGKTTNAQIGKLSERIERSERAQAEPAAKLAKIGEAIERIERRAPTPPAAA